MSSLRDDIFLSSFAPATFYPFVTDGNRNVTCLSQIQMVTVE